MASTTERVSASVRPGGPSAQRVGFGVPARFGFSKLAFRRRRSGEVLAPDHLPGLREKRTLRLGGGFGIILTILLFIVAPTAVAGYYYAFLASDIYLSEAKFAVRGTVEKLGDSPALQMMTQLTSMNSNQDAYIVADYIRSLPLIEKVQEQNDIRSMYSRSQADFWSRLDKNVSAEKLHDYWGKMVRATVDNLSGVVTLQVKAFTPEDSLAISKSILAESEKLVNELSIRRNQDAVKFAKLEVDRAEERVQAIRLGMQEFRNQSGSLDPIKEAEATFKLAMTMRAERITLENEIVAARRTLNENAPSLQVLNARLAALKEQIGNLERTLTGAPSPASVQTAGAPAPLSDLKTASAALYKYEGLELERMFAEKLYMVAQTALERARETADKQGVYLVTFVQPALAEIPLFPKRGSDVLVVLMCTLGVWSVAFLITAAIRDHSL